MHVFGTAFKCFCGNEIGYSYDNLRIVKLKCIKCKISFEDEVFNGRANDKSIIKKYLEHAKQRFDFTHDVVIFINGKGGAGKDTVVDISRFFLKECTIENYSTITKYKEVAEEYFFDGTYFVEKRRKLLSQLKEIAKEFNDAPFEDAKFKISSFMHGFEPKGRVLFIHSRETEEIDRLREFCNDSGIRNFSILVDNGKRFKWGNPSDDNVSPDGYVYDFEIDNSGTTESLRKSVQNTLREIKYRCEND